METIVKRFDELTLYELYDLLKLRAQVFVVEQNCPYQDLDDIDKDAYHVFIVDEGEIVACARVIDKGKRLDEVSIGRVISARRRQGLGTTVMNASIKTAKQFFGAKKIKIGAQEYAIPFYQQVGFKVVSDTYLEDGIPHKYMIYEE
jgi:ElaA protein